MTQTKTEREAQLLADLLADEPGVAAIARMRLCMRALDPHADRVYERRYRASKRMLNYNDVEEGSPAWYLGMAFKWANTPEGDRYWRGLCARLPGGDEDDRARTSNWRPWEGVKP